jgi:hypothetical protein
MLHHWMEHPGRGGGGALFRRGTQTLKGGEARAARCARRAVVVEIEEGSWRL